jgi:hypothetical protein
LGIVPPPRQCRAQRQAENMQIDSSFVSFISMVVEKAARTPHKIGNVITLSEREKESGIKVQTKS